MYRQTSAYSKEEGDLTGEDQASTQKDISHFSSPTTQLNLSPDRIRTALSCTWDPASLSADIIDMSITSASRRHSKIKLTACINLRNVLPQFQHSRSLGLKLFVKHEGYQVGGELNVRGAYDSLVKKQSNGKIPVAGIFTTSKAIFEAVILADVPCVALDCKCRTGEKAAYTSKKSISEKHYRQRLFKSLRELEDTFGEIKDIQPESSDRYPPVAAQPTLGRIKAT